MEAPPNFNSAFNTPSTSSNPFTSTSGSSSNTFFFGSTSTSPANSLWQSRPELQQPPPDILQNEREKQLERARRFGIPLPENEDTTPSSLFVPIKRYSNPFRDPTVAGFALDSEEEKERRERRIQRFGSLLAKDSEPQPPPIDERLQRRMEKFKSLEDDEPDVSEMNGTMELEHHGDRKDVAASVPRRLDTLHLYGTDKLSTEQIFQYFFGYQAKLIEWINDSSCNVIFDDAGAAEKAFLEMSEEMPAFNYLETEEPTNPLFKWRKGKPLNGQEIIMRYATSEDVRPLLPKPSRYYENIFSERKQQRSSMKSKIQKKKETRREKTKAKKKKRSKPRRRQNKKDQPHEEEQPITEPTQETGPRRSLQQPLLFSRALASLGQPAQPALAQPHEEDIL
jgi:hypothetical protein